jgi:uncharacterized protein (UPF0254 family)
MSEIKVVIRQDKAEPDAWHVAAQVGSEEQARKLAKDFARSENKSFGVNKDGDCLGNKTSFFVFDKEGVVKAGKP